MIRQVVQIAVLARFPPTCLRARTLKAGLDCSSKEYCISLKVIISVVAEADGDAQTEKISGTTIGTDKCL